MFSLSFSFSFFSLCYEKKSYVQKELSVPNVRYKQSQKGNAKGVLLRQAAAGDSALIGEVFG